MSRARYESIQDAAERLDVDPRTIRRAIAAGKITGYRVGGRLLRVRIDEIDNWVRPIPTAAAAP